MAGIYVHIPFCLQSCHYCDFHFSTSLKTKKGVVNAINQELVIQKNYLQEDVIQTIYFGGGTPSLIDLDSICSILKTIRSNFKLSQSFECTIEANPDDINRQTVNDWHSLGFNRVSLGVQSFRNTDLNYMNRSHTNDQSLKAIRYLRESSISNFSIDLIYGYPILDNTSWENNLQTAIKLDVPHISSYCMTVEKQTPLYFYIKNKKYQALNSKTGQEQFLIARHLLIKNGYQHYEISNFSKNGYESKHNQNYWNKTNYLGVGPSAHSFNGHSRQWNIKNNVSYCKKVESGDTFYTRELLTRKNTLNEYILTRIRTSKGISKKYVYALMNSSERDCFDGEILRLAIQKLVKFDDEKILLTETGMLFADSISENLFLI